MNNKYMQNFLLRITVGILLLFSVSPTNFGQSQLNFEMKQVATFSWNTSDGLPYSQGYDMNYGFSSFEMVDSATIAFLCPIRQCIKVFNIKGPKLLNTIHLDFVPADFTYNSGMFYIQHENIISIFSLLGKRNKEYSFSPMLLPVHALKVFGNKLYALTPDGKSFLVEEGEKNQDLRENNGWPVDDHTFVRTQKLNDHEFSIDAREDDRVFQDVFQSDKDLGTVLPAGRDGDDLLYYIENVENRFPLKVGREIKDFRMEHGGFEEARPHLDLPDMYYIYMKHDYCWFGNYLYHAVTSPEGCRIFRIRGGSTLAFKSGSMFNEQKLPGEPYDRHYHYNDFTLPPNPLENPGGEEHFMKKDALAYITRDQILQNAAAFLNHDWKAAGENIWNASCRGKTVLTPSWVKPDSVNHTFPYMWGGFSSINQFDDGLAAGRSAGDRNTDTNYGAPNCAVGLDCSGFVSRAWNMPSKQSTSTLPDYSDAYYNLSQLLPGDILNRASSHVRLVTKNNPSGLISCMEATSGNNEWRVLKRDYDYNALTGYVPRHYKYVKDQQTDVPSILSTAKSVQVYPNPCRKNFGFTLQGVVTSEVKLEIYDLLGKRCSSYSFPGSSDGGTINVASVPLHGLPSGIYLLKFSFDNQTTMVRKLRVI